MTDIPGYVEAYLETEKRAKLSSLKVWSSATEFKIKGIRQKPLTFRALDDLKLCENPFIVAGEYTPEHVANYLWRNSPFYVKRQTLRGKLEDWNIWRAVLKHGYINFAHDIIIYINDVFEETPENILDSSNPITVYDYAPDTAFIADEIGSRYGAINPLEVPDIPVKTAFQLMRVSRYRTREKYQPPRPASINRLKAEGLKIIKNG